MPTTVSNLNERLALKRLGPSEYSRQLFAADNKKFDLRVSGTYIRGDDPNSTVRNGWVWTARLNGEVVDSPETLTRKREAVDLLKATLATQGYPISELYTSPPSASEPAKPEPEAQQEKLQEKIDETHPAFKAVPPSQRKGAVDPILSKLVRVKGTTLVGTVIGMTQGDKPRLRLEFPEGFHAWAARNVVEEVGM